MKKFQFIYEAWLELLEKRPKTEWTERLESMDLELCHYKGYLRETFHQTKFNPQLQLLCAVHLKNNPRNMIKLFCSHARSEVGHDLLALEDLEQLGENKERAMNSRPQPSTLALCSFPAYQIQFGNPLHYLGYLFHLEFLPTTKGAKYVEGLKDLGIPDQALTFLSEHVIVDEAHNKMMKVYIDELLHSDEDINEVLWALDVTVKLQAQFLANAFENGEKIYK